MTKFYDFFKGLMARIKLGLEYWKMVSFILTFLGLAGSAVGNYLQSEETESYKQGYIALAENVKKSQQAYTLESTNKPQVITRVIKCDCSGLEKRLNKLETNMTRYHGRY